MKIILKSCLLLVLTGWVLTIPTTIRAVELRAGDQTVIPDKVPAAVKIKIDGRLDEEIWQKPSIRETFVSFDPNFGDPLSQETEAWVAYDKSSLYFAFKCYDKEPHKIKTSIGRRDKVLRDDLIGILVDSLGNKQSGLELYVNPHGIQVDALTSTVSGFDIAPDFVWESAGRIAADGYRVEIRIPLESLRFKSGKRVEMGLMFIRHISRTGTMGCWPAREAGQSEFNYNVAVVYEDLKKGLDLEVLPSFVYSRSATRQTPDTWDTLSRGDVGVSLKYGITSSVTAEATVNPDFSQVESDVFQVEVNQRYPVFYSEKRPFFMEASDVFDFAIISEGMMISPVHTRYIVDPNWAAKLSGSAGKMNFALLAADDRAPGYSWENGSNPNLGQNAFFGIFRAKYNFAGTDSLGVLYGGRSFAGGRNDVAGLDFKYGLGKSIRATLSYLHSITSQGEGGDRQDGGGLNAMLEYHTSRFDVMAAYERYDTGFSMATAFQNRTGLSRGWFALGPRINVKIKGLSWLRRIQPFFRYSHLRDLGTGMDDATKTLGLNLAMARQGSLSLQYWDETEAWAGRSFQRKYLYTSAYMQLFKWLFLGGRLTTGEQIFYHPTDPFLGKGHTLTFDMTVQPHVKWNLGFNYLHSQLAATGTGEKIYSLDIFNLHGTFQFNKYFFLRAIARYDNYAEKLLTDLLASFTLIPGTVVHLGYGSLHTRNQWQEGMWRPGQGEFLNMKRGLFFKAGYRWRIR